MDTEDILILGAVALGGWWLLSSSGGQQISSVGGTGADDPLVNSNDQYRRRNDSGIPRGISGVSTGSSSWQGYGRRGQYNNLPQGGNQFAQPTDSSRGGQQQNRTGTSGPYTDQVDTTTQSPGALVPHNTPGYVDSSGNFTELPVRTDEKGKRTVDFTNAPKDSTVIVPSHRNNASGTAQTGTSRSTVSDAVARTGVHSGYTKNTGGQKSASNANPTVGFKQNVTG